MFVKFKNSTFGDVTVNVNHIESFNPRGDFTDLITSSGQQIIVPYKFENINKMLAEAYFTVKEMPDYAEDQPSDWGTHINTPESTPDTPPADPNPQPA